MGEIKEECGGCMFYLAAGEGQGLCRRNPPQMTMMSVKTRKDGKETEFSSNWQFPPMMSFGWCGEFMPSEVQ